jgi:hypothetical protein
MRAPLALFAVSLALSACGPVSVQQAESQCFERARLAAAPRGEVAFGVGSNGPAANLEIGISSDFIAGRDPSAVYDTCVMQKSGQPPRLPLYMRPDWSD